MVLKILLVLVSVELVFSVPPRFETFYYKVGIEYDHSLPMTGGSDRYRHRNNYDPFFVTVSAAAKNGFVISYLEVKASVDEGGTVDFTVVRGQAGSKSVVFQLISNQSDFLRYSYMVYGIREEEYKKITNIINVPVGNGGTGFKLNITIFVLFFIILFKSIF